MTNTTTASPPSTARSADGTAIAYELHGAEHLEGGAPVVVLVGGATVVRAFDQGLAAALAAEGVAAVAYDRRGRGDSGDTPVPEGAASSVVAREVEDLAAVLEAAAPGRPGVPVGHSSGAALVLQALAAGLPADGAVVFEPPYRVDGSPPLPEGYVSTLEAMAARGERDEMLVYFQTRAVGLQAEMVEQIRQSPMWALLTPHAHTLAYDAHCLGGETHPLPADLLGRVAERGLPLLALASTGSAPWLAEPARLVAEAVPGATSEVLPGEFHSVPDGVFASRIAAFVRALPRD